MTGSYTLSYREAAQAPAIAGPKGAAVGRLAAAGFRVPGGFVLSVSAYEDFAGAAGIDTLVKRLRGFDDLYTEEALLHLDRIRLRCLRAPFPESVRSALAGAITQAGLFGVPLAVRSSAVGEDSPGASFAGIYRSLLNVLGFDALEAAVRSVWASLWTPRAVSYRRQAGLRDSDAGMAVIVQRLVMADAAGVAFTRHPVSGADEVVLNAAWGLGEGVVSGAVETDTYVLRPADGRLSLIHAAAGSKAGAYRPTIAGGTTWQSNAAEWRRQLALSAQQAEAIGETARRIEQTLDGPQDIEWARVGDDVAILQARPITGAGEYGSMGVWEYGSVGGPSRRPSHAPTLPYPHTPTLPHSHTLPWGDDIWSAANLAEVVPRVPTPLAWSMSHLILEAGFREMLAKGGYAVPPGVDLARLFEGRPYFNLAAFQWLYWDAFGVLPEETNRSMGGHQPAIAVPSGDPFSGRRGWARRWRYWRGFLVGARAVRRAPALIRAVERQARALADADLTLKRSAELLEAFVAGGDAVRRFFPSFLFVTIWATASLIRLEEMLSRHRGEQALGLATALLAGSGNVASADQGYLLQRVAGAAAGEPRARAFFEALLRAEGAAPGALKPTDWRAALSGTRAGGLFEEFLNRYGHRAVQETEVAQPRWAEDPSYPLEVVAGFVVRGAAPLADVAERVRRARATAEGSLGLVERPRFGLLLQGARQGARLRENAKSAVVAMLAAQRRLVLEVAKRMVRRNLLGCEEDIFFLRGEEIRPFLLGEPPEGDLRELAAERRRRFAAHLSFAHPEVIVGNSLPEEAPAPDAGHAAVPADGRWVGLAISAGRAEGLVRILRHPSEGTRLCAGEVLVAPTTDPAWTPLFLRAAGLIMETGGFLSHGAIVAREYGRPAVANVPGITHLLRDGIRVSVDGDTGEIRILDAETLGRPGS